MGERGVSTVNRMADGYEPRFDIDMEIGRQGEIFITSVIDALKGGASVEVKTDERALSTGNIYVEYLCLRSGVWEKSGLATTEAEVWAYVLGDSALCIPTSRLKELGRIRWKVKANRKECMRGSHPTKGVTIPILWMLRQMPQRAAEAT